MIGDRWGVSDDEMRLDYPCDTFVDKPALEVWRGVSVKADTDTVWTWLRQVRVAPYSYDLIDNLGRRSPRERLDLTDPVVGEPFTQALGRPQGRVVATTPGEHLTAQIMGAFMSYVVRPSGDQTRLLLKVVTPLGAWLAPALSLGDLVMARKQLLTFKRLAESDQAAR